MRVVGYYIGEKGIASSKGYYYNDDGPISWLVEQGHPDELAVLYHLDWSAARLCRMLGLADWQGRKLLENNKLYVTPWTIRYIPGKLLSIDHGSGRWHPFITFSNAHQYAYMPVGDDGTPPDMIFKASLAQTVGQKVYDTLVDLGLHPKTLISPVNTYQKEVLSQMDLPTVDDYPDEVGEWAYSCCKGSWLEAFKRGHWEQVWDYDINSAYANEIRYLPELRRGRWTKDATRDPHGGRIPPLGILKGKLSTEALFHPFLSKDRDGSNSTPTGIRPHCMTLSEYWFLIAYDKTYFSIEDAWWWDPIGELSYPLMDEIDRLYAKKTQAKGISREVIKRIMAGIYGLMIQYKGKEEEMGPLFNSVWAAEVETGARLEVANFCNSHGLIPIHVAVDGVISDRNLGIQDDDTIGSWRLSGMGPALVFGTGTVALRSKHGSGDFSLDYDEIHQFMLDNPEATEYTMAKTAPMTIARALASNSWHKVGEPIETQRTVDFGFDQKRCWPELRSTARELLENEPVESVPWDISLTGERLR